MLPELEALFDFSVVGTQKMKLEKENLTLVKKHQYPTTRHWTSPFICVINRYRLLVEKTACEILHKVV